MEKALEILEHMRETGWCGVKQNPKYYSLEQYDNAIAEIKAFEKECENLVIESQKLVNETLDLGETIIKQNKRILELEEMLKPRTCYGCKYFDEFHKIVSWSKNTSKFCDFHKVSVAYENFYCSKHEPKD